MEQSKIAIWILIIGIGVWILSLSVTPFAQELSEKTFAVKVIIEADKNISSEIESYIKRELRSLGDVKIVEAEEDCALSIIVIDWQTGIAFSFAFLAVLRRDLYPEIKDTIEKENVYLLGNLGLRTGSPEDLRKICEGIVAEFDTEFLEKYRNDK